MKTNNLKIATITFMIVLFLCLTALDLANGVKVGIGGDILSRPYLPRADSCCLKN